MSFSLVCGIQFIKYIGKPFSLYSVWAWSLQIYTAIHNQFFRNFPSPLPPKLFLHSHQLFICLLELSGGEFLTRREDSPSVRIMLCHTVSYTKHSTSLWSFVPPPCPFWRQSCLHSWWIKGDRGRKKKLYSQCYEKYRFNFPYHLLCQKRRAEVCSFIALGEIWLGPKQGINIFVFCPSVAGKWKIYCCFLDSAFKIQI